MNDAIRRRQASIVGMATEVAEVGDGDADEAVVFLHGNPGSWHDWEDLLPRVAPFGRAVAFDLPGFGAAEKPADLDYSGGLYATFIAAAFAELGIRRAHLVMHDLGGTGLFWAVAHPDAFASAVLINTGILIGYRWHFAARIYRAPLVGEIVTRLTTRSMFRATMRLMNPQPREVPDEYVESLWRNYDLGSRRAGLRFYRATPPSVMERLVPALHDLDRPALVVWGAHDPAIPVEQAERQRQSFPSADVVILEDSGHWPHVDDPERVAEAVVPFLQAHRER